MADFNDFKLRYPELVSTGDTNRPAIEASLADAAVIVDLSHCPRYSDVLQLSWTAHDIAKSGNNPNGIDDSKGPINSESVGSVSRSYSVATSSVPSTISDYYRSTAYGQKFLMYLRMCFPTGVMTAP